MDITFSTFRIVVQNGIDNRTLTIDDFKQVEFPSNFTTENNGLVYDCSMSLIDNSYLWIYSKFGNPNPCPNQVFDKNKSQYQNNTRTPNLVEMRKQLFVLFDFDNNMLYLNISNKRKFVEEMLKTKLDLGITISSIYTDLNDFDKVSIKMAKNQGLSLNPTKLNGMCGKLLCCLKYEDDFYLEMLNKMPKVGQRVSTPDGEGEVKSLDMLHEQIEVMFVNGEETERKMYPLELVKFSTIRRNNE